MKVFVSHSHHDKPQVLALVEALAAQGIECWVDKYEIAPGGDIVAGINAGLEAADAGIVVLSRHSEASAWVKAETSALTWARVQEGKVLVPITLGEDPYVPPLLRPMLACDIDDPKAVAEALRSRLASSTGPRVQAVADTMVHRVRVEVRRTGKGDEIQLSVHMGEGLATYASRTLAGLPASLLSARQTFLRGAGGVSRVAGHRRTSGAGRVGSSGPPARPYRQLGKDERHHRR